MNPDKIRELAEQAEMAANKGDHVDVKIMMEKFAELIVKECCEVAHCNFHVDGLTLGNILREHFGVES